jgi:hypothetical protein
MFNPMQHMTELVVVNVYGGALFGLPDPGFVHLPDGQVVPSTGAGPQTYWLSVGGVYTQVSEAQAFVQDLWLHYAYGKSMTDLYEGSVTAEEFQEALYSMPNNVDDQVSQFDAATIVGYAQQEAPWIFG